MKYLVRFFVIISITFCTTITKADENFTIVYINMEKVFNESLAGKSLIKQLEDIHKNNINGFKKTEKVLKSEEELILSQKNILSEDEYNKKVFLLKKKINEYKDNRKKIINSVSKKKVEGTAKLMKEIEPILTDFSKKNSISIILKKKDIVIAKTELDITNEIIKLVDSKVKEIVLN